jgi:hypothetical protein
LALIANGSVTPAAASQPYYAAARVAAWKQAPDAASRLKLLLEAMAIRPDENLRIDIFRAAATAHRDRLALTVLEPVRNRLSLGLNLDADAGKLGEIDLPPQIALFLELVSVRERLGDMAGAEADLRLIVRSGLSTAERATLDKRIARAAAITRLAETNQSRRPILSRDGIAQQQIVRPRREL